MPELLHVQTPEGWKTIPYQAGESVHAILYRSDLPLGPHCSQQGQCGRCRIKWRGECPPPNTCEKIRLHSDEINQGVRLACQHYPQGECKITLLRHHDLGRNPNYQLKLPQNSYPASATGLGIALDFGTTQIRISIWDLCQGKRIVARSQLNPLMRFGQDILTRICLASESLAKAHQMLSLCAQSVFQTLQDLCDTFDLDFHSTQSVHIVANTAMLGLLGNFHQEMFRQPGFWLSQSFGQHETQELKNLLKFPTHTHLHLHPSLGGFVGSDLWADLIYSNLCQGGPALLMDFGTNTEIALWDGQTLWLCSAAGGPAFDGCGTKCGIHSSPGAICQIQISEDRQVQYQTIDAMEATGLCGTGLIDCAAELLNRGIIKSTGHFSRTWKEPHFTIDPQRNLFVDQADLGLLQQASAAIKGGLLCLLHKSQIRLEQLQALWICGDFGAQIPLQSAQKIGLIPDIDPSLIHQCPQAALLGCEKILNQCPLPDPVPSQTINLSCESDFEEFFLQSLLLEPLKGP